MLKYSTATVIGAMIIDPLMVQIVAAATALAMGDLNRAGRAFSVAVAGVIEVLLVALISAAVHPIFISFGANTQITGRVSASLVEGLITPSISAYHPCQRPDRCLK